MDTDAARKRLEEIRDELDRSICGAGAIEPASRARRRSTRRIRPMRAPTSPSRERTAAMLALPRRGGSGARRPRRAASHRAGHLRGVRRLRCRGARGAARGQARRGPVRGLPGQAETGCGADLPPGAAGMKRGSGCVATRVSTAASDRCDTHRGAALRAGRRYSGSRATRPGLARYPPAQTAGSPAGRPAEHRGGGGSGSRDTRRSAMSASSVMSCRTWISCTPRRCG